MKLRKDSRKPTEGRSRPVRDAAKPNFISYHASRQQAEARQQQVRQVASQDLGRPKQDTVRNFSWMHWAIGLVLAVCALYSLSLSTNARFTMTNPRGVPLLRAKQEYQDELAKLLGGSLLNQNKITIDTDKLTSEFANKFPELDKVEIVLPFMGRRPVVEATTSTPALFLSTSSGTYVIDGKGRAVIDSKSLPADARALAIPTVKDQADIDVGVGKAVLSKQDVAFITSLYQQFAAKQMSVSSVELPPLASELRVRVSGKPYYIKFSLLTDSRVAVGQYLALDEVLTAKRITPSEYVDSRVEEKIYYK